MTVYEISPARGAPLTRPAELICFALIVGQLVYLAASYLQGSWIVTADGGGLEAWASVVAGSGSSHSTRFLLSRITGMWS